MDASEREAIKGKLLDRWIEDLRQDKAPTLLPEIALLSPEERAEVLELARWYKGSLYHQSSDSQPNVEALAKGLRDFVLNEQEAEARQAERLVDAAPTFGALIREACTWRTINPRSLEQALKLPTGTINRLEVGELPPHRVPVESMLPLLRGLRLESGQVVKVLQETSITWANAAYNQAQTQLGRTDAGLTSEARRELLSEGHHDERANQYVQELTTITRYCDELARRLA
jgi:hypothetical protein